MLTSQPVYGGLSHNVKYTFFYTVQFKVHVWRKKYALNNAALVRHHAKKHLYAASHFQSGTEPTMQ